MFTSAMRESFPQYPWRDRKDSVFWSGTLWPSSNANARKSFADCSSGANYSHIVFNRVVWGNIREFQNNGRLMSNRGMKPIFLDSRRALEYKFGIYIPGNTWSSYLKRLLASGVYPILPKEIKHHSHVVDLLLQHCTDCFLTYDPASTQLCDELSARIALAMNSSTAIQHGENIVRRLSQFIDDHLSYNNTLEYMYETITALARKQSKSYIMTFLDIHKKTVRKFDCKQLRKEHFKQPPWGTKTMWQYDEWYDEQTCAMRLDSTYLRYLAI
jgi:hypothetical protein